MMVLIILGAVLLFLFLLTVIPVRFLVGYQNEFSLKLKYLFLTVPLLPGKEEEKEAAEENTEEEKEAKGNFLKKLKKLLKAEGFSGFIQSLNDFVKLLGNSSKKLLSHVKLSRFDLYLKVAGAQDAAEAAIFYGEVSTAVYSATGILFGLVKCRKKGISVDLDYKAEEHAVVFSGKASIKPLFVIKEGVVFLLRGLPFIKKFL